MTQNEKLVGSAVEKLRFINTPLHPDAIKKANPQTSSPTSRTVSRPSAQRALDEIRLAHNDDATNLEIFYDLFLACINLFNANQQLTTLNGLSAYCGFFGLIWTTWFMTGMYDVRFLKDSIFERIARGVHLGVLVGFVVISPNFDTKHQDPIVFKAFTIILMASRLCLAIEYGSVLYHLRDFPGARLPVGSLVVKNAVAAFIYLGVAFRFRQGHNSSIFSVWYILAGFEIIGAIFLSYRYRFLSFQGTYIMKRMGLLTCIFFGEGVASACSSITKVIKVENHGDVWTSQTIGTVTACIALIYIVYMVYSDWVSKVQLPGWRQMTWVLLHFPLHLVMMLFMEGCSQFIVFWKISEKSVSVVQSLVTVLFDLNSATFVEKLKAFMTGYVGKFRPTYSLFYSTVEESIKTIEKMDLAPVFELIRSGTPDAVQKDKEFKKFFSAFEALIVALENNLYGTYGIDFTAGVVKSGGDGNEGNLNSLQQSINTRSFGRFRVVFQYTFVSAGIFLGIANLLSIISRTKKWTWSAAMYHSTIFLLSIGISLVAAISQNERYLMNYQSTPLVLPTLLLTYVVILTMNHVSGWLAAKRDKEATRKAAMSSEQSTAFGPEGKHYDPIGTCQSPVPLYVAGDATPTYSSMRDEGSFDVPRRPVPNFSANYASQHAV